MASESVAVSVGAIIVKLRLSTAFGTFLGGQAIEGYYGAVSAGCEGMGAAFEPPLF
ncbi:MAG: hypothetical protein LBC59_09520 [Chitinispirillales bacterium]|nr:hypothetical protein [Chitinispirillales bacterium]